MSDNGSETTGELIYRALAAALKSEGRAPATDLPPRIDDLDEDARLVLAFLLTRSAPRSQDTPQSLPEAQASEVASVDQAQGGTREDPDLAIAEDTSEAQSTGDLDGLADPTDLPAQMAEDDPTDDVADDATAYAPDHDDPASIQDMEEQVGSAGQDLPLDPERVAQDGSTGTAGISRPTLPDHAAETASEADALGGVVDQDPSKGAAAEGAASGAEAAVAPSSSTPPFGSRDLPHEHPSSEKGSPVINGPGGIPKVGPDPRPEPERISLPNGRTNTDYEAQIDGYADIRLRDGNGTGLSITPGGRIRGAAMPAGEYTLVLGATKGGRSVEIVARLSVIARPQDLWKAIPSDQEANLAKPDEASKLLFGPGLVAAASKRGRSHAQEGSYRDDHFEIDISEQTGWHILIVADGAGSAPLSREGSKVAATSALAALHELLPEVLDPHLGAILEASDEAPDTWKDQVIRDFLYPILPKAAFEAAVAVEKRSKELQKATSDLSTTLIIAVAKKLADRWFVASFTLGDGGVALYDSTASSVEVMCRPDSGEFAGQTRFLTTREFSDPNQVFQRIFVSLPSTFTALFALTDGITDPKFPTDSVFSSPEAWTTFWHDDLAKSVDFRASNSDLQHQLLDWLDFWSRGNHDDRTLAVLVPQDEGADGPADKAVDAPDSEAVDVPGDTDTSEIRIPPAEEEISPPSDGVAVKAAQEPSDGDPEIEEAQAPAGRPGDQK